MTTPITDTTALATTLNVMRARMAQIHPTTEDAVALRRRVVDPVLDALGWTVEDPNRVAFAVDVNNNGQVVDYILKLQGVPLIAITASPDGVSPVSMETLVDAGVPWHLATTGHNWTVRSCAEGQIVLQAYLNEAGDTSAMKVAETLADLTRDAVIKGSLTRRLMSQTRPGQTLPATLPASPIPGARPSTSPSAIRRRGIPEGLALDLSEAEVQWLDDKPHNAQVLYHAWRQALHHTFPDGLALRPYSHHVTARAQGRIVAAVAIEDESIVTWLPISTDWVAKIDGATDVSNKKHPGSGDVEVRCSTLRDVDRLAEAIADVRETKAPKTRTR